MKNNKRNKGTSLVGVLVSMGLLSAISIGVMQITQDIDSNKSMIDGVQDQGTINAYISLILKNPKHCTLSIAGEDPVGSPVTFNKVNVDQDTAAEGLAVELWLGNQAGTTRTSKKLSSTDAAVNKMGKLTVTSLKLYMLNNPGANYTQSASHDDVGEVIITMDKKIGAGKTREIRIVHPINVQMSTDAAGLTTINSCTQVLTDTPDVAVESGTVMGGNALMPINGYSRGECHAVFQFAPGQTSWHDCGNPGAAGGFNLSWAADNTVSCTVTGGNCQSTAQRACDYMMTCSKVGAPTDSIATQSGTVTGGNILGPIAGFTRANCHIMLQFAPGQSNWHDCGNAGHGGGFNLDWAANGQISCTVTGGGCQSTANRQCDYLMVCQK